MFDVMHSFSGKIDNVVFLSGLDFASSTVGYAGVDTMCRSTIEIAHSINQATSPSTSKIANIVTHEMGHNFGLSHVIFIRQWWGMCGVWLRCQSNRTGECGCEYECECFSGLGSARECERSVRVRNQCIILIPLMRMQTPPAM